MEVDCGTNHTIARDSDGRVYSWGFGGYGRLGHAKQEDLWSPMPIDQFTGTNALTRATKIAAGSTFSMALDGKFCIVNIAPSNTTLSVPVGFRFLFFSAIF